MLALARSFGEAPVVMADLAEREGLSRKYLHALLTGLKAAGLARSVRGAGGGFVLARDPSEIKLKEIMQASEGSLCLVDCVEDQRACDRANGCSARGVWQELSGVIDSTLDSITLADVVAKEKERKPRARGAGSRPCGRSSGGRRRRSTTG
jgi:Rrf2 family protein